MLFIVFPNTSLLRHLPGALVGALPPPGALTPAGGRRAGPEHRLWAREFRSALRIERRPSGNQGQQMGSCLSARGQDKAAGGWTPRGQVEAAPAELGGLGPSVPCGRGQPGSAEPRDTGAGPGGRAHS